MCGNVIYLCWQRFHVGKYFGLTNNLLLQWYIQWICLFPFVEDVDVHLFKAPIDPGTSDQVTSVILFCFYGISFPSDFNPFFNTWSFSSLKKIKSLEWTNDRSIGIKSLVMNYARALFLPTEMWFYLEETTCLQYISPLTSNWRGIFLRSCRFTDNVSLG